MSLWPGSQKIQKKVWLSKKERIGTLRPTCRRHPCFRALAHREHIGACSKFKLPFHPQSPAPPPPLESRFLPQFPQIPLLYSLYSSSLMSPVNADLRAGDPEVTLHYLIVPPHTLAFFQIRASPFSSVQSVSPFFKLYNLSSVSF